MFNEIQKISKNAIFLKKTGNGKYYKYDGSTQNRWLASFSSCLADGASLPKFSNQEEYQAIIDILGKKH
jgi:hypothetical protein